MVLLCFPTAILLSPPELDVLVLEDEDGEDVAAQPEQADQGHEDGLHQPLEAAHHLGCVC